MPSLYLSQMGGRYEHNVKERKFEVGDLIWRTTPHVRGIAGASKHKFSPNWEGPYLVEEAHKSRYYWLKNEDGTKMYSPINGAHLKNYFP